MQVEPALAQALSSGVFLLDDRLLFCWALAIFVAAAKENRRKNLDLLK